jgi:plasmid stabilization system protein ParE
MRYFFHPEARLEYLEAAAFYEKRRAGLGAHFTIEVEATIGRILESPARWPVFEEDVRRCLTHIFPYGILYSVEGESILIVAVMHCSRRPGYWKERVGEGDEK